MSKSLLVKGLLVNHFLSNFYCLRCTKLHCQWFGVHYINRCTKLMNASQIKDNIFGIREREFTVYPGKVDIVSINLKKSNAYFSFRLWLIFYKTKKKYTCITILDIKYLML